MFVRFISRPVGCNYQPVSVSLHTNQTNTLGARRIKVKKTSRYLGLGLSRDCELEKNYLEIIPMLNDYFAVGNILKLAPFVHLYRPARPERHRGVRGASPLRNAETAAVFYRRGGVISYWFSCRATYFRFFHGSPE